jgi:hypothetical protein
MAAHALPVLLLILAQLLAAGAAHAQAIHKCRDAEGRIAYQDQPCPAESLPLPPIDGPPSVPYVPAVDGAAPAPAEAATGGVPPTPPVPPLPARFRCTREDGESYVSTDPSPPPRYVPAWVVGATSTSSNLRRTPAREAWDRSVGGAYVLVQDRCRPMSRGELCAHWGERLDVARRGARASFFDERESLEREAVDLRAALRAYCGR